MNTCLSPLAWGSGSATHTGIIRSCNRGETGQKWWKSCTDCVCVFERVWVSVCGSGGWGRTGLTRKVSDLKWQIQNWTEIMWLQGQSLLAWTTLLFYSVWTFKFAVDLLFIPIFFLHKRTKWFERDRLAGHWAHRNNGMNSKEGSSSATSLLRYSSTVLTHAIIHFSWTTETKRVELSGCSELFCFLFFFKFLPSSDPSSRL